ncbi:MAG TPA: hypothetical protein VGN82_14115 [Bosea sp. (in: a-proteobacteria)]|jgi:hypothetical protein|uniref:hypothetical protein n=1 Tax=Bosea sp. (in: a-proteobacteria) TaxID=1871050 RepID=UPI002E114A63|nr:hypothetical protein [Bosea sp. (in: a-proteobacteria)]
MDDAALEAMTRGVLLKLARATAVGVAVFALLLMQTHHIGSYWKIAIASAFVSLFNVASGAVAGIMLILALLIVFPPDAVKAMAALFR